MGSNEQGGLATRRENLSPVGKALYDQALKDIGKVMYPATGRARPATTVTNAWNRVRTSTSRSSAVTDIPNIMSGIMSQIEALDTALKENANGLKNLNKIIHAATIPSVEVHAKDDPYGLEKLPDGLSGGERKNIYCQKLAEVIAQTINAKIENFDFEDSSDMVVLQMLIDICDNHTAVLSGKPMLNTMTENMSALYNWKVDSLTKILDELPTKGLDGLNAELDDTGTEMLTRMLGQRYGVTVPRSGLIVIGDQEKQKESQTSQVAALLTILNQVENVVVSPDIVVEDPKFSPPAVKITHNLGENGTIISETVEDVSTSPAVIDASDESEEFGKNNITLLYLEDSTVTADQQKTAEQLVSSLVRSIEATHTGFEFNSGARPRVTTPK